MPTDLVVHNGLYLAGWVREVTIPCFQTYTRIVVPDILSSFDGLDKRAEAVSETEFDRIGTRAVGEDSDGDLSGAAEAAFDTGVAFYQLMADLRQATVNLLSVGLFHLIEQQLASISADALFQGLTPLQDTKLSKVRDWYRDKLELELSDLERWSTIHDELRQIANTVKHAEGTSASKLRFIKPEYFEDPALAGYLKVSELTKKGLSSPVQSPLTGNGFYLSDDALREFGEAVLIFLESLASKFAEFGDKHLSDLGKA